MRWNCVKFDRSRSWSLAVMLAVVMLSGCGHEGWKAKTYATRGTVIVNGAPAENVIVMFHSQGKPMDVRQSVPYGLTSADGAFEMTTYEKGDGVPAGEYGLTLYWPMGKGNSPDRLAGAYLDPANPMMMVTIEKKRNELPPIKLSGVKVLKAGPAPTEGEDDWKRQIQK